MSSSKVSINKILFALLKTAVSVLSLVFIYTRITERENFEGFIDFINLKITTGPAHYYLAGVVLLMFVNYGIEALKWKLLISHLSQLSFARSMQAIFLGTTISFFTPNRVGEFAGRVLFLEAKVRIQAILSTFVGSISQLLVTVVLGLLSISLLAHYYNGDITAMQQKFLVFFALMLCVFLLGLFPRVKNVFSLPLLSKIKIRYSEYVSVFESYTNRELWNIFGLSLLRYIVFTLQYILLLQVCDVQLPVLMFAGTISILFLLQALIPTVAFTELAFRGSLAILIFEKFTGAVNGIVVASFGLWLVNLALPAAIGSLMFLYFKLKHKNIQA